MRRHEQRLDANRERDEIALAHRRVGVKVAEEAHRAQIGNLHRLAAVDRRDVEPPRAPPEIERRVREAGNARALVAGRAGRRDALAGRGLDAHEMIARATPQLRRVAMERLLAEPAERVRIVGRDVEIERALVGELGIPDRQIVPVGPVVREAREAVCVRWIDELVDHRGAAKVAIAEVALVLGRRGAADVQDRDRERAHDRAGSNACATARSVVSCS